jgi:tight adherence protein B
MSPEIKFVLVAVVAFVLVFIVLSKVLADKTTKYAKKSLARISRDGGTEDINFSITDDAEERFAQKISKVFYIGSIYKKLKQSGSNIPFGGYMMILFVALVIGAVVSFMFIANPPVNFLVGVVVMMMFNRTYLGMKLEKRNNYFLNNFPDAIDMMVRSVKSGHPIMAAMKLIAQNAEKPISTEFQRVVDEVSYGRSMTESLRKMADRIGILDINFFVVILSVQQETGGSLAEVLTNLSNIIRKRKQLKLKINALTSEGRITTKIFGGIPIFQMMVVNAFSDTYLDPLFDTRIGNICFCIAVCFIIASVYVTKRITRMDDA